MSCSMPCWSWRASGTRSPFPTFRGGCSATMVVRSPVVGTEGSAVWHGSSASGTVVRCLRCGNPWPETLLDRHLCEDAGWGGCRARLGEKCNCHPQKIGAAFDEEASSQWPNVKNCKSTGLVCQKHPKTTRACMGLKWRQFWWKYSQALGLQPMWWMLFLNGSRCCTLSLSLGSNKWRLTRWVAWAEKDMQTSIRHNEVLLLVGFVEGIPEAGKCFVIGVFL